jgi:hypothetical protein
MSQTILRGLAMVEEFTDLGDCYRTPLVALAKQLAQVSRPGS